jgi:phosphatidylinositol alpha-1,6-mannosyltransferase
VGKRILVLATDAYGGHGGIALYGRNVIEALCTDPSIDEVLCVPRVQSSELQPLPSKLCYDVSGLGGMSKYLRALGRQLLRRSQIDLIYCTHINLAPVAWAIARLRRVPWAVCLHGIDAWPGQSSARKRFFASRADLVISVSRVTLDRFLSWCPMPAERTLVLPNAIHLDQYGPAPKSPELLRRYGLQGKKVIMTFGRLDPTERYKGFDEIMELMPAMLTQRPELMYLVAGMGGDRARLEEKASALGITDKVVFTGPVDEAEKADTYRLADVYAMPSTGEGFGFVFLEAMACGVPAIASDQDGGREAVREGLIGQVVDPQDGRALEAAILRAIDQPKQVPEGLAHFGYPAFAERVRSAVHDLIAGRARGGNARFPS